MHSNRISPVLATLPSPGVEGWIRHLAGATFLCPAFLELFKAALSDITNSRLPENSTFASGNVKLFQYLYIHISMAIYVHVE